MVGVEGWFGTGGWFVPYGWIRRWVLMVKGWWMTLGWLLLMVSFFWCVKQPKVVYFVEFYAFRVLRAFVVFYP
ncbi:MULTISPECIES: hypothetical protein [unclassified Bartonella]|uniref:hypothetical protein n=1 Tax=unclassified Bartonella TaxID=2645622 RepID=UPI0035D0CEA4